MFYCIRYTHKIGIFLHAVYLSFPDVLWVELMLCVSGSMVVFLYIHKKRRQQMCCQSYQNHSLSNYLSAFPCSPASFKHFRSYYHPMMVIGKHKCAGLHVFPNCQSFLLVIVVAAFRKGKFSWHYHQHANYNLLKFLQSHSQNSKH